MADQNGFAEWGGYMDAKITKLEEQFSAVSAPFRQSNLFAGISIFVNGLTNPSADELKRIMMVHGGTFHHYERKHTTFTIASNIPDVKVRNIDTSKIISPQYVVDCVKGNRILDYTPYLLHTNRNTTQQGLGSFLKGKGEKKQKSGIKMSDGSTAPEEAPKHDSRGSIEQLKEDPMQEDNKQTSKVISKKGGKNDSGTSTALTAVNPNFLPEFYNNSRLHHIATLGAGFKQYISELREKHDENAAGGGFPPRLELRERMLAKGFDLNADPSGSDSTFIMHIDVDCFFVSVGLRKHPELRGLPVAVTHSKGGAGASSVPVHQLADREAEMELFAKRFEHSNNNILSDKVRGGFNARMSLSEIASCSYEARKKGIRNGMFVGQAMKLCPELKTIPYDFEDYKDVAFTLYNTVAQYTLQIEAVSCDEMYVDLSDLIGETKVPAMEFVQFLRAEVREKTGCPCSAGVGANKLQARMATKRAKPDGQFHLKSEDVENYMTDIPVQDLPGVGSNNSYILKNAGIQTCGDLRKLTENQLQGLVGKKFGRTLYQFCRGNDDRELAFEQLRKSVSAEVNYGIRFSEHAEVEKFLHQLCEEVHSRLVQVKRKTKCVTLKVMIRAKEAPVETSKFMGHGVCDNITKSVPLNDFTQDINVITNAVLSTMKRLKLPPNELRGIGIQLTKLDKGGEAAAATKSSHNHLKEMFSKMTKKRKDEDGKISTEDSVTSPPQPSKEGQLNLRNVANSLDPSKNQDRKKRSNVLSLLQNAQLKKRRTERGVEKDGSFVELPSFIDMEVFDALPEEMREEIRRDCKRNKCKSTSIVALKEAQQKGGASFAELPEKLQAIENIPNDQPSTSRAAAATAAAGYSSTKLSPMNIFIQPHYNKLMLDWIKSDHVPTPYDIQLCRSHAIEMVRARMYNDLYERIEFLRRLIDSKHSLSQHNPWGAVFCQIMNSVQEEFSLIMGGRRLFVAKQRGTLVAPSEVLPC